MARGSSNLPSSRKLRGRGAETLQAQLRALLRAFQRGTALVESLGTCLTAEQRWGAPSAEQRPAGRRPVPKTAKSPTGF